MATQIRFSSLPLIVRLATMATFFMLWVGFEELVIDRFGLDRYLPFYRVAEACLYDLIVAALLVFAWWRMHRN